jgi:acetyl/propionyl-CoA carboxylase alpha subunit
MALMASILVANRGEIARRIMRTARRLGVRTIAVYSEADAGAAHVREADQAVLIGPAAAADSYLSVDRVLQAAQATGARAIHPGYGFLSENADFADAVIAADLTWVGPPPSAIRAMGRKDAAKRLMREAGVGVTPGYLGEDQSAVRLAHEAAAIGWPVLIKAVAGGGGKGMRKVDRAADFAEALASAKREGAASFGDDRVLLEKYVTRPRHIEVQIFGDAHGNVVHLFERDCSLQRRHQKVIEEAPAPGMSPGTRQALCAAAVRAGQAVGYQGAGTVEFIADASEGLRADRIWFMEMNTRLQVEHPVTEAVTGVDLVEWQLRVSCGEPLPLPQDQIRLNGHAMEARLYAEDPAKGFLPSAGRLLHMALPDGVRVDSGFEQGDVVTPHYDPMIAKLIVHAADRSAAAAELANACGAVQVWPVKTNAAFLARCAGHADFVAARVHTDFIGARIDELTARPLPKVTPGIAAALEPVGPPAAGPWRSGSPLAGFRMNAAPVRTAFLYVDGAAVEVDLALGDAGRLLRGSNDEAVVFSGGDAFVFSRAREDRTAATAANDGVVRAPMPGRIVQIKVRPGDYVPAGQTVLVLEAMKMEHALTLPFNATVAEIMVGEGDQVVEGAGLARLEPAK